ncbi:MAG: 30S ribosomal protein S20 [Bacillota bacterium]
MPIIESAKKRVRVTKNKKEVNDKRRKEISLLRKDFDNALEAENNEKATEIFNELQKKYHQAAEKNLFHKKNVAKKISKLHKRLNSVKN